MTKDTKKNPGGHPRSFKTVEELQTRIDRYVGPQEEPSETTITDPDAKPTPKHMAGLAVALGVSRETLAVYARGEYDTETEKYSDAIKQARTHIESHKLTLGLLGVTVPSVTIFDLKNNHGYTDKQELTGAEGEPLMPKNEEPTLAEIKASLQAKGIDVDNL